MKGIKWIRKKYNDLQSMISVIRDDRNSKFDVSLLTRMRFLCMGFSSDKYRIYNFQNKKYGDYLSDYCRYKTRYINRDYSVVFNNKLLTERLLSSYIRCPKNYALIQHGNIVSINKDNDISNINSVIDFCKNNGSLVLKPISEGSGKGFALIKWDEGFFINYKAITKEDLISFITGLNNYLIVEFINQGEFSNSLYPYATNTIRMLTMVDPVTKEPFIARAVQRIGNEKTKPTDNFRCGRGGLNAQIDLDTGTLGQAISITERGEIERYDRHPDDIVVIEINNYSGVTIFQVHGPILTDKNIRRFYEYHGIL